jgi:hypothetical protein
MRSPNVTAGQASKITAGWFHGVNSVRNPWSLNADQLKWAVNCSIRGGVAQTRAGQGMRLSLPVGNLQGGIIFSANKVYNAASTTTSASGSTTTAQATIYGPDGNAVAATQLDYIVFAVGGQVYYSPFPLVQPQNWNDYLLTGITLDPTVNDVNFVIASKTANINNSGDATLVPTYNIVMVQDGINPAAYWDGSDTTGQTAPNVPIGDHMAFSGQRLWVSSGAVVFASDLGDPLSWIERTTGAGRGDFNMPRNVTAMVDYLGQNQDTRLIVFTDTTTYSLASGVLNRDNWPTTANFQNTLFANLGCIAKKSITFQAGMMWWYSMGGLVSVDVAAASYLSSQVLYKDAEMARAKRLMPADASGICSASFENYLLCSIPYQETLNSATMVLDYAPASEWNAAKTPAWCGVWTGTRPVVWTTGIINNQPRCFHFSVDYAASNDGSYNHLWESFLPERVDSYLQLNADGTTTTLYNRIYAQMETALLGDGMELKQFLYADMECSQMGGIVDLRVSYRGSKGGYQEVLNNRLLSATDAYQYANSPYQAQIDNLGLLNTQYRRITTETAQKNVSANSCESSNLLNVDKAFSLLVEWCGEFGVEAIQTYMAPYSQNTAGNPSQNEQTMCVVGQDGTSASYDLIPSPYDQPNTSLKTFSSTQTISYESDCFSDSASASIVATATASFLSYLSQANADINAAALARQAAQAAAQKYRQQNPC